MFEGESFRADVSPDVLQGTPLIRAYGDDYFKIAYTRYTSGISIHQNNVITDWGPERLKQLRLQHLQHLFDQPPELLLIGTGRQTYFPDEDVLSVLADKHIAFECMDSRSAARTYNILVTEGRVVSVGFLLPNARN
ncbi:MAG: MTH938/NDUFAF3 family protein [Mariprofundaceae bacterium]|nr:MTH938/NDUFAF3 family protein [Mariprofundaceae bacterium]